MTPTDFDREALRIALDYPFYGVNPTVVLNFARAIAKLENESCAAVCDALSYAEDEACNGGMYTCGCAKAIRARQGE